MLKLSNLTVKRDDKVLLKNIELEIYKGKVNVLTGHSGSGKTLISMAIMNHLNNHLQVSDYRLLMNGECIKGDMLIRGKTIGYISQDYTACFNQHQTIGKQLERIYRFHFNVTKRAAKNQSIKALESVGLPPEILKRYVFDVSLGQLQRVQIASVLMLQPQVIIADEITSSLDLISAMKVMEMLTSAAKRNAQTLFLITHDVFIMKKYADYITVIKDGEIVSHVPPDMIDETVIMASVKGDKND